MTAIDATDTPLTLKGFEGQTANLLDVKDNSDTLLASVDKDGDATFPTVTAPLVTAATSVTTPVIASGTNIVTMPNQVDVGDVDVTSTTTSGVKLKEFGDRGTIDLQQTGSADATLAALEVSRGTEKLVNIDYGGNLNLLTGALQYAGEAAMSIRQITGPTYDTSNLDSGQDYYYFTSTEHHATGVLSQFGVYGLKTTLTPKSSDSWIAVVYKPKVKWYDDAHNAGGRYWLTLGNTQAQGENQDGTAIAGSEVWEHRSFSGGADSYLNLSGSHFVFIPPSAHTTAELVIDVIIAADNSDGCYVYNGADHTSLHAIEIG